MSARLRQQQTTSLRHRAVSAAFLASDRNRRHAKGPAPVSLPIMQGFGGPCLRPKLCRWIAGEPSADDKCKCRAPVAATKSDERPSPYCAMHEAFSRAHGRRVAA